MEKISEILKEAVSNLGEEEKEQFRHTVITRADTQAEADALFGVSPSVREQAAKEVDRLFVQAKVARKPNTSSSARDVMSVKAPEPQIPVFAADQVKTAAIDEFFDEAVGVYERYPELLKVAGAGYASGSSKLVAKPKANGVTGPTPVQSSLSGGAA
jgi:hypothetical protein